MDRSLWVKQILREITAFVSEDFGEAAWAGFRTSCFVTFEDVYGLAEALSPDANPYRLDSGERQVLAHFALTLAVYEETRASMSTMAPWLAVSQPEWQNVRTAAVAVLRHFEQTGFPDMPPLRLFSDRPAPVPMRGLDGQFAQG
jgi:hypothetical protein